MGDEFWAQTQADLQGADDPLFSKPKLGENLLKKPPFRFLHDVVTGIQKSTGFAPGLFSEAESDAKAVASDKEAKALYLSKIIATVEAVLGEAVPAKPQKIMAGLEPENTNVFLQQLARAARSCRSTDQGAAAVAQVMSGGGGGGGGGDGGQEAPPPAPAPPPAAAEEEPPPRAAPEPEAQDLPPPPPPPAPAMEEPAAPPAAAQPDVGGGGEEATAERKHSSRSGRSRGESRESREGSRSRERDSRSRERDSRSREGKDKERRERKERKKREEAGAEAEAAGAGAGPDSMERPPSGQQRPGAIMRGVERPQSARRGPPRSGCGSSPPLITQVKWAC